MAEKEKGKVKWFNNSKGYGFIEREKGDDIFLHYSSIKMDGYRTVKEGQEVEFVVTNGAKGLQADEVSTRRLNIVPRSTRKMPAPVLNRPAPVFLCRHDENGCVRSASVSEHLFRRKFHNFAVTFQFFPV